MKLQRSAGPLDRCLLRAVCRTLQIPLPAPSGLWPLWQRIECHLEETVLRVSLRKRRYLLLSNSVLQVSVGAPSPGSRVAIARRKISIRDAQLSLAAVDLIWLFVVSTDVFRVSEISVVV